MASFFVDLWKSVFTPGPTPSIVVATNVSFAALQVVLISLLVATHSVHFAVLSFLCASLWWAINWFIRELEEATAKEEEANKLRQIRKAREDDAALEDSGTETEGAAYQQTGRSKEVDQAGFLSPDSQEGELRKRVSQGDASSGGEMSTDGEWDKVEEAGEL